jgi:2-hydroxy-3-keto-5-methylthiopentenyl-1-phosphate phosphatase
VLVTDFDGTVCRRDFYHLVIEHLQPAGTPDFWGQYLAGQVNHFDALRLTYAAGEGGEPALLGLLDQMEPDPDLGAEVAALQAAGWRIVVASAGCAWYIERLLERAGVREVAVHANPGSLVAGRLQMIRPIDTPHPDANLGISKVGVVEAARAASGGAPVAFAGDSLADVTAGLRVEPRFRFARAAMAQELSRLGEPFQPFERWADVAQALRGAD